jgi:hypothetical protein
MPLPERLKGAERVASILVARHLEEIIAEASTTPRASSFSREEMTRAVSISLLVALSQSPNDFQDMLRGNE